jgi:hypothetical protein
LRKEFEELFVLMWLHETINVVLVAREKTLQPKIGATGAVLGGSLVAVKGVEKHFALRENGSHSCLQT